MAATGAASQESYSQWVRRVIARRPGAARWMSLFESSVPEPRALLADLAARAFTAPVDPRYASAFSSGNPFVVQALCRRYAVGRNHILCTTGATAALALLYRALAPAGSHVLVETPGFDLFFDIARRQGIAVDGFPRTPGGFAIDVAAIAARVRPDTRLIVISNLHNPSGMLTSDATMLELAAFAEARDLIVLVDEVYGDYADRAARPVHAAALSPRLVSIGSLTKIYGLSTLRCGWIVADPALLLPVRTLADRTEFGISNFAHAVAAMVLEDTAPFDAFTRDIVAAARPMMTSYLDRWLADGLIAGAMPDFGCTVFPRLIGIDDTVAFADWLAERAGVIVAPGEYFGAPGYIRIGFARAPADLRTGLDLLDEGLRSRAAARRHVAARA